MSSSLPIKAMSPRTSGYALCRTPSARIMTTATTSKASFITIPAQAPLRPAAKFTTNSTALEKLPRTSYHIYRSMHRLQQQSKMISLLVSAETQRSYSNVSTPISTMTLSLTPPGANISSQFRVHRRHLHAGRMGQPISPSNSEQ